MPRQRVQRGLAVELLEDRKLLAGVGPTVSTYPTKIVIEGTAADDTVDVYNDQGELVISVGLKFQRRNHVTIPAKDAAKINLIQFNGGRGDDFFHNHTGIKSSARGGWGFDKLIGGSNSDMLYGEQGHDVLIGGDGDDILHGDSISETRIGKYDGNDILRGGAGVDTIYGQGGHDDAYGDEGEDYLDGGPGVDILHGGPDKDRIHGGSESDLLLGDSGDDTLDGGTHNDVIYGGRDVDELFGNSGNDCLFGGRENDTIKGGPGDDYLSTGLGGRDTAIGDIGSDVAYGFAKYDTLVSETVIEGTGEMPPEHSSCHPDEYSRTFSHPNGKYRYIKPDSKTPPAVEKQAAKIKVDEPLYKIVILDEVDPGSKDLPKGTPAGNGKTRGVVGPANFRLGEPKTPPNEAEDREAKRIRLNEQRAQIQKDLGVLRRDQNEFMHHLEFVELYPEAVDEYAYELDLAGDEVVPFLTERLDETEAKTVVLEDALAKINLVLNSLFGKDDFESEESNTEDSGDSLQDGSDESPLFEISFDEDYTAQFGSSWTAKQPLASSVEVRHVLTAGTAQIELLNDLPERNPVMPFDVNLDSHVTPIDALFVINRLNNPERYVSQEFHAYVDSSGDGFVTPVDALLIINHLNNRFSSGEGPAPTESTPNYAFIGIPPIEDKEEWLS